MNWAALFPALLTILLLLVTMGGLLLTRAKRLRKNSGLPPGEVVYEDASGLARAPLYSSKLGLAGKPDYLLRDPQRHLIPVEVKSGYAPRDGHPYESHRLQLAAYFFLIEDALEAAAPYGVIRYRNRTLQVANSEELRRQLMEVIAQMRTLMARGAAHRNHEQTQRCARCSMAHACEERLA